MIRRELPHHWLLISQTTHAALSGAFAALWSRTRLRPRRSVVCAVGRHDDGWRAWERLPKTGGKNQRPLDFPELSLADNLSIWNAGPACVAARDPYAGLLVSLHGASLMERKLALAAPDSRKAERIEAYLAGQRALRASLVRDHAISEDHLGPRLDANLHLLQLCDFLSLLLCWRDLSPRHLAFGRPDAPFWLDLSPGGMDLAPDDRTALRVRAGVYPWPFGDRSQRRFRVAGRLIPRAAYDGKTLRRALDDPSARTALEIDLVAGQLRAEHEGWIGINCLRNDGRAAIDLERVRAMASALRAAWGTRRPGAPG